MPPRLGAWNCTASSSNRVSTGVDILRVADLWACAIACQTGPRPWRLMAEMKCNAANFRNGKRVSICRWICSRW
ncbi:Uncharacterised protein [Mycobacterium tuberculosis]|nr:Uncharacterised protein [Mycobacterium tuberculosis]